MKLSFEWDLKRAKVTLFRKKKKRPKKALFGTKKIYREKKTSKNLKIRFLTLINPLLNRIGRNEPIN